VPHLDRARQHERRHRPGRPEPRGAPYRQRGGTLIGVQNDSTSRCPACPYVDRTLTSAVGFDVTAFALLHVRCGDTDFPVPVSTATREAPAAGLRLSSLPTRSGYRARTYFSNIQPRQNEWDVTSIRRSSRAIYLFCSRRAHMRTSSLRTTTSDPNVDADDYDHCGADRARARDDRQRARGRRRGVGVVRARAPDLRTRSVTWPRASRQRQHGSAVRATADRGVGADHGANVTCSVLAWNGR